jgi:hypothetical protein
MGIGINVRSQSLADGRKGLAVGTAAGHGVTSRAATCRRDRNDSKHALPLITDSRDGPQH